MEYSPTVQCSDCGRVIPAEDVLPYEVSRWSRGGRGVRGVRPQSRRQRVDLCPNCHANRKRWDYRIRGVGGLIGTAVIVYTALRAFGVL